MTTPQIDPVVLLSLEGVRLMFKSRSFDICVVRAAAQSLHVNTETPLFEALRTLHCVSWDAMSPEARVAAKLAVCEVLGIELDMPPEAPPPKIMISNSELTGFVNEPAVKQRSLLGKAADYFKK